MRLAVQRIASKRLGRQPFMRLFIHKESITVNGCGLRVHGLDALNKGARGAREELLMAILDAGHELAERSQGLVVVPKLLKLLKRGLPKGVRISPERSEERRVGKECRL